MPKRRRSYALKRPGVVGVAVVEQLVSFAHGDCDLGEVVEAQVFAEESRGLDKVDSRFLVLPKPRVSIARRWYQTRNSTHIGE